MYLVLEMCHNGEMSRYLKDRKLPFSEDEGQNHLLKALVLYNLFNVVAMIYFMTWVG